MATLSRRDGKKGSYYVLRWMENGRERKESLGIISKAKAETLLHAKEIELRTGRIVFSHAPLFRDLAERYKAWHRVQYPDSHWRIEQIIDDHLMPVFSIDPADQIQPLKVETYKADRLQKVKAGTVSKEIRTLKALLNWGVEMTVLNFNPVDGVKAPKSLTSKQIHWYEMEQLVEIYKGRHPDIWQFMVNTGIRRGEVDKFQDRGESIVIESSEMARTKSGRWREVPLSVNARDALNRLGGKIDMTGPNLSRAFRHDLPANMGGSLHSLRHTFGTHQAMKGTPIRVLQQLMGHGSVTVTEKYLHIAEKHLQQAMVGFNL